MSDFVLAPAACPLCGSTRASVFIRSDELDDLVCMSCREGGVPSASIEPPISEQRTSTAISGVFGPSSRQGLSCIP